MIKTKLVKASEVAKFLNTKLRGKDILIQKPVPVYGIVPYSVSFIKNEIADEQEIIKIINKQSDVLIICPPRFEKSINCSVILSKNPYFDFSKAIKRFFRCPKPKIKIGKNCIIKAGAIIGGAGFSYQKNEKGIYERTAQIGGVTIGDNVEIGSWTAIDRGVLTDTIIGSNVIIDNLVHIAHNCMIGEGTTIAAGAVFGGGAVVGKNCFIGLNASIKQRVKIGNNAVVGMGAVVIKDIPSGMTVVGNPAKILTKK